MAIRLMALGASMLPMRSTTRARGKSGDAAGQGSASTSSLFLAPARSRLSTHEFGARSCGRSGAMRKPVRSLAQHAQHALRACAQPLDDARFVAVAGLRQPRQHALAAAQCAGLPSAASTMIGGGSSLRFPVQRPRQQFAVRVLPVISSTATSGSSPGCVIAALGVPSMRAFGFQLLQMRFSSDAVRALDAEEPRQIALGRAGISASSSSTRALSSGGALLSVCCAPMLLACQPALASSSPARLLLGGGFLLRWRLFALSAVFPAFALAFFAFAALLSSSCRRPWPRARRSAPPPVPA